MSSSADDFDGLRLPRRGDAVIRARHDGPECVSGKVQGYLAQRVTVETDGEHGIVQLPASRFTWSPKRRAWVCWPKDVCRRMKELSQMDELRPRIVPTPAVGDAVLFEGRTAWVMRLIGKAVSMGVEGMSFNALKAYRISTADGQIEVEPDQLQFDDDVNSWVVRAGAQPQG